MGFEDRRYPGRRTAAQGLTRRQLKGFGVGGVLAAGTAVALARIGLSDPPPFKYGTLCSIRLHSLAGWILGASAWATLVFLCQPASAAPDR
jgi:hypothetical protein